MENRVMAFIAAEMELKRGKIQLSSRISDDLGIDGDDAVELFEKFGREFSVDLQKLWLQWELYFVPEGLEIGPGFWILAGIAGACGFGVSHFVPAILAWASSLVILILLGWLHSRFLVDRAELPPPVTVQDMVDAARAGRWVKESL